MLSFSIRLCANQMSGPSLRAISANRGKKGTFLGNLVFFCSGCFVWALVPFFVLLRCFLSMAKRKPGRGICVSSFGFGVFCCACVIRFAVFLMRPVCFMLNFFSFVCLLNPNVRTRKSPRPDLRFAIKRKSAKQNKKRGQKKTPRTTYKICQVTQCPPCHLKLHHIKIFIYGPANIQNNASANCH